MRSARISDDFTSPQQWEAIPRGMRYRKALEYELQPWLGKMFGFHLLKIGNLSAEINTENCAISHQVSIGIDGPALQVHADPLHLPFAAKSVDACLLAHTLGWEQYPHRILRETDRVLVDDGWLIMSNFNPISVLGLGKVIPFLRRQPPYNCRMLTPMRLFDWLVLLNFEVLHQRSFLVIPGLKRGGDILSTHLPALGCMHLIVARKRTLPLTINLAKSRHAKAPIRSAVGLTRQSDDKFMYQVDNRYP